MKHVVHVASNLKGGGELEISPKTLIVGPNGSGKSSIVNAIELALTGKASDIAGRDVVAKGADLASLGNGSGAWAEVTTEGGEISRWEVKRKGKSVSRPSRTGPEGSVPLREVVDNLTGSADKARKFLLQQACAGLDNTAIIPNFDDDLLSRYQRLTDGRLSPVDNLLAVTELAGKKMRDVKKEADHAESMAEELAGNVSGAVTDEEVQWAQSAYTEATEKVLTLERAISSIQSLQTALPVAEIEQQVTAIRTALDKAEVEQREKTAALAAVQPDKNAGNRDLLLAVMNLMRDEWTNGPCLACGSDFDRHAWEGYSDGVRQQIAKAKIKHKQRDDWRAELQTRLGQLNGLIQNGERKLADAQSQWQRAQESKNQITDSVGSLAELDAELVQARERAEETLTAYTQKQQAKGMWAGVERAKESMRTLRREQRGWGNLFAACTDVIEELVDGALATFSNRVQRYLPETDVFGIRLGKTDVRYGLIRDGEVHSALSGAEWARISCALAAACTPEDAETPVLVPQDRAWDPKTLREALGGLSAYRGQVIVTTTVKPYRGVPKGWEMIELGD